MDFQSFRRRTMWAAPTLLLLAISFAQAQPPATAPTFAPVKGIVRSPNGAPVEDAKVYLVCGNQWLQITDCEVRQSSRFILEHRTAADGRFELSPIVEPSCLLALNELGSAVLWSDEFPADEITLPLKWWGSVSGVCMVRDEPAVEQNIRYSATESKGESSKSTMLMWMGSTKTDATGRYHFARVPAMPMSISRSVTVLIEEREEMAIGHSFATHGVWVEIEPGADTVADISRTGREVVGRVVTDANEKLQSLHVSLTRDIPPPLPPKPILEMDAKSRREWQRGPEMIEYYSKGIGAQAVCERDGTFRFEDIPPGRYKLWAIAETDGFKSKSAMPVITIDPAPPDAANAPLDLGEIKAAERPRPQNQR